MDDDTALIPIARRKTIHNIKASQEKREQPINDLATAFHKRWKDIKSKDINHMTWVQYETFIHFFFR